MFIGSLVFGPVVDAYKLVDAAGVVSHNWSAIWVVPAAAAAVVLVLFAVMFNDRVGDRGEVERTPFHNFRSSEFHCRRHASGCAGGGEILKFLQF